jgi:hypothetical protein
MKCLFNPPKVPNEKGPFADFIQYLVKWIASERVMIQGWNYKQTAEGRFFVPPDSVQASSKGTGPFVDFWDSTVAYAGGSIVQVPSPTTYNAIVIQPGTYALRQGLSTTAGPVYNSIPQYPYPMSAGAGNVNTGYPVFPYCFWILLSFGPKLIGTCAGGSGVQEYANTTGTF